MNFLEILLWLCSEVVFCLMVIYLLWGVCLSIYHKDLDCFAGLFCGEFSFGLEMLFTQYSPTDQTFKYKTSCEWNAVNFNKWQGKLTMYSNFLRVLLFLKYLCFFVVASNLLILLSNFFLNFFEDLKDNIIVSSISFLYCVSIVPLSIDRYVCYLSHILTKKYIHSWKKILLLNKPHFLI